MTGLLTDRRVVAVGIDNNLGAHICLRLALEGCHVIGIANNREFLAQIKHEVRDVHGRFDYVTNALEVQADILLAADSMADCHGVIDSFIVLEPNECLWQNEQSASENGALPDQDSLFPLRSGTTLVRLTTIQPVLLTDVDHPQSLPAESTPVIGPALVADTLIGLLSKELIVEPAKQYEIVVQPDQKRLEVLAHHSNGQGSELIGAEEFSVYDIAFGTNVHVRRTDRGRGLYAARDFCKDELVMRTSGCVIDFQTEHSIQISWDLHVEPDPPIRLINHSCEPNMGVRTNAAGLPDFVALRDIHAGEEVTFDYAMTEYKHYDREDPRLEFSLACRCGSERCRQRLGYYSELSDQLRQEYAGYVSDYLAEIDKF